jgi:hypothetical protein
LVLSTVEIEPSHGQFKGMDQDIEQEFIQAGRNPRKFALPTCKAPARRSYFRETVGTLPAAIS